MWDRFCMWLAWKLPRRLVKWCALRLMANATTGDHGHHIVSEVTILDALDRWGDTEKPTGGDPEISTA